MHEGWGQQFNGAIKYCSGLWCRAVTAAHGDGTQGRAEEGWA